MDRNEPGRRGVVVGVLGALLMVVMLHWSLTTLSAVVGWLDEPRFVHSLALSVGLLVAGRLLAGARHGAGAGSGRRRGWHGGAARRHAANPLADAQG